MKKIKTVTIFVLFGFLLKQTYEGSDSQCHKDVAKTVISVKRCPVSAEENEIAALRKACNQIPNECASFVYHCLVNRFFNDTYEFCAPAVQIVYYLCAEFNKGGGVIQNSQHKEGHCKTCPIAYYSSESYKFRECYDRVMREVDNISNTQKGNQDSSTVMLNTDSSKEITTINSTFVNDDTEKTEDNMWIILVAGFFAVSVFSVAVCCCIYYRRRICRKGDYTAIKGKETNGKMEHSSLRSGEDSCKDTFGDSFKDKVTFISETENDTSSKEVIGMTEKEPLMTSKKEKTYQIKKYKEEWVRKVKSQQRRRCLSENDSKEYIPIRRSSDDLQQGTGGLNELQENTPLSERKNARIKDSQESLKRCENHNLHSAFGASGSVFDEANDDEDDLIEFARKATHKFIKKGEKFRDVLSDLYTFNHKETLKQKRSVVQTEKIKESLQQENEIATKKKKNEKKTKKGKTAEKDKNDKKGNIPEKKEQKRSKKEKTSRKKDVQKKATKATTQIINNQLMELTDLGAQFNDEEIMTEKEEKTSTPGKSQQTGIPLTATWSLCTSDGGFDYSPAKTTVCHVPEPPQAVLDVMNLLCKREVQDYLRNFSQYFKQQPARTFLRNEIQRNEFENQDKQEDRPLILQYPEWPGDSSNTYLTEELDPYIPSTQNLHTSFVHQSLQVMAPQPNTSMPQQVIPQEPNTSMPQQVMPQEPNTSMPQQVMPQEPNTSMPQQVMPQQPNTSMLQQVMPQQPNTSMPQQVMPQQPNTSMLQQVMPNQPNTFVPQQVIPQQPNTFMPQQVMPQQPNTSMLQKVMPQQPSTSMPSVPDFSPRRSPRKHKTTQNDQEYVKLLETSEIRVPKAMLRKATTSASQNEGGKASYTLTSKLAVLIFNTEELAQSRGQGIRDPKKGDIRPTLDHDKLDVLKEYVNTWCQKNGKGKLEDKFFNDAITERISYSRKLLKKNQTK